MEPSDSHNSLDASQKLFNNYTQILQKSRLNQVAIRRALKKYQVKNMKVNDVTPLRARRMYDIIKKKYENDIVPENNWFQNERRIFVWVLLCYIHKEGIQIKEMTKQNYDFLHSLFPKKDFELIKFQTLSLIKRSSRNQVWSKQQDQILAQIVKKYLQGVIPIEWGTVSRQFFSQSAQKYFRNSKQCRERWLNHLDPNKTKGKWQIYQDKIILNQVLKNGKKWSKIAHALQDKKNEHMVKNRYKSLIHKMEKKINSKKVKENIIIEMILKQIDEQCYQDKVKQEQIDQEIKKQQYYKRIGQQEIIEQSQSLQSLDDDSQQINSKPNIFTPHIIESKKLNNRSLEIIQMNQNNHQQGENSNQKQNQNQLDPQNQIQLIGDGQPQNNNQFLERIVQNANTPTAQNRFSYMFDARSPSFMLSPFQPAGGWTPTIFFMEDPQGQISPQVGFGNFSSKYMNDLSKFVGGDQVGEKKK